MAFIPHTDADVAAMLAVVGVPTVDALFDEIPERLKVADIPGVPPALSEMEVGRLMQERAAQDGRAASFIPPTRPTRRRRAREPCS